MALMMQWRNVGLVAMFSVTTGNISRTAMTSILETRLEGSLVSNQGKWPHQTAQTIFIGDKFDAVS